MVQEINSLIMQNLFKLTSKQKEKLKAIGKRYNLRLAVVYGSWARGTAKFGSDLDIGVLGKEEIEFDNLLDLAGDLEEIFSKKNRGELDVKSLHRIDFLFRWQVMKDSILIYGSHFNYISFKIYAWRAFQESQSLFCLEEAMAKKGLTLLKEKYA